MLIPISSEYALRCIFIPYIFSIFSLQLQDRDGDKDDRCRSPIGIGTGKTRGSCDSEHISNPRMSLLGKPLSGRPSRKDIKYRKLQAKIYNFLERPTGRTAAVYHALV